MKRLFCSAILLAAAGALCSGAAATGNKRGTPDAKPAKGLKTPGVQIPFSSLKADVEIALEGRPSALAVAGPDLLAPNGPRLDRVEGKAGKLSDKNVAGFGGNCGGVASGFDAAWIPDCQAKSLHRADLKAGKLMETMSTGTGSGSAIVAASPDSVWLFTDDRTTLTRIDPQTNTVVSSLRLPEQCSAMAFGETALWAACPKTGKVLRIDPARNMVAKSVETAAKPIAIAFGDSSVWVLCEGEGKISRIDPKTNTISATIELSAANSGGGAIAYGEGSLWVTMPGFPLTRITADGNKVFQQFYGTGGGGPIATGFGSVWLAQGNTILRFDPKRIAATLAEE